jgi:hypothetical protein
MDDARLRSTFEVDPSAYQGLQRICLGEGEVLDERAH